MKNIFSIIIIAVSILLLGCSQPKDDHDHAAETEQTVESNQMESHDILLTTAQLERIGISYDQPMPRNLRNRIKVSGYAELPAENEAHLSSYMDGKITSISIKPGQMVHAGQVMLRLSNPQLLDWQRDLDEALAQLAYYQKEQNRLQSLVALDPGQRRALDEAQMQWTRLNAQQHALRKKLDMLNIKSGVSPENYVTSFPILAPFSGFVQGIDVNMGEYVTSTQPLLTMVNLNHLHWEGKLSDRFSHVVKPGQTIELQLLQGQNKLYPVKIYSVGQTVDADNHTFMVHAELPINAEIKPGMYLEGWISTAIEGVPSVPLAALVRDRGLDYVMVQDRVEEDHVYFKKVPVKTGIQDGSYIEISWLSPVGDQPKIAVAGAFFINAEAMKLEGGGESEHSH